MTDPLDKIQQLDLKSLPGKLNWISTHSRPDNAHDVCQTNNSTKEATAKDRSGKCKQGPQQNEVRRSGTDFS